MCSGRFSVRRPWTGKTGSSEARELFGEVNWIFTEGVYLQAMAERKYRVLFLCTHNSARSQMAEGLMNALLGDRFEAFSAGTEPRRVHPLAIQVMREIGIDIAHHESKSVETFRDMWFDVVVTVCDHARETCPFFPNATRRMHRSFPDPSAVEDPREQLEAFRRVRDAIRDWILETFGK